MGLYLAADDDLTSLASNTGWSDFGRWTDGLKKKDYGELKHLYQHGWSQDRVKLEAQLAKALDEYPPKEADVTTTAEALLATLQGIESDVVHVTDGLGGGSDDEDEDEED